MSVESNQRMQRIIDEILESLRELSYEVRRQERTIAELRSELGRPDQSGPEPRPERSPLTAAILPAA